MRIFLISGISGSGKSVALDVLEDAGYFCVDNLPPSLLPQLITTLTADHIEQVAVAIDIRSAHSPSGLLQSFHTLKNQGHQVDLLFLTAKTTALIARFSETRRSHPLSHRLLPGQNPSDPLSLSECIRAERTMLNDVQAMARVIDTSGLKPNQLKNWIRTLIDTEHSDLTILFESFAYKVGVPLNADCVFDVRNLPNPYYEEALRPLTGQDEAVKHFLSEQLAVTTMFSDIAQFIEKWLPSFKQNNRSYLTICIGCTGGQHRSVYIVEQLAQHFYAKEQVIIRHRELDENFS